MCFSASASFGASVALSAIGAVSLKKVQQPSQIPFASIPLIFAVQQFTEGIVWLSLSNPAFYALEKLTTHTFLFFAQILWPLCVPIAILLLEKNVKRKKLQKICVGAGVIVSLYYAHRLLFYGVHAKAFGHHIAYQQDYPATMGRYIEVFYGIATIAPTFISSVKRMWIFGTSICISYIITAILYNDHILSVWCFFASLLSVLIVVILSGIKKQPGQMSFSQLT